jgi:hypothetical protein
MIDLRHDWWATWPLVPSLFYFECPNFYLYMFSYSIPRVVDPANPYNNVYDVVEDWVRVEKVARETIRKPLFDRTDVAPRSRSGFF